MPPPTATAPAAPPVATRAFCLADLAAALATVERRHGLMVVRCLVSRLSWRVLADLAERGLAGEADNDPRALDPRHLLLPGMAGPAVRKLQRGLYAMRFDLTVNGRFDADTRACYEVWLDEQAFEPRGRS